MAQRFGIIKVEFLFYTTFCTEVIKMSGYEALSVETCGNCKYFRRHYIRRENDNYSPLQYGHCVYPRLKKRRTEEHCAHWTLAETGNACDS